jgi:signal transduction histidine kinase/Tfp pilus assembly protein PilF
MKYTLAFALISSVTITVNAQRPDSLQRVLSQTKSDSTRSLIMSDLADEFTRNQPEEAIATARSGLAIAMKIQFRKGMYENYLSLAGAFQGQALFDSAIYFFRHAEHMAVQIRDDNRRATVYSGMGHSFMRKSDMDSARFYMAKGLALAQVNKNYIVEAGIYNNYGNVFLEESNYEESLRYFVKAATLYDDPLHDDYGQCLTLANIGNIEYRLGNYDAALEYARQSMALATKNDFTSNIGYVHKLQGRIYRQQKKFDDALLEYKAAQKVYLYHGDGRSAAELLQNIGNIYFDKSEISGALKSYEESLVLAKKVQSRPLIANAYNCIGQAAGELGNTDVALIYFDSALVEAKGIRNRYLAMDVYQVKSETYKKRGEYKDALEMHELFVKMKDSVVQSENRGILEETQARYEVSKKEARIALLERDTAVKNLQIQRHRAIQIGVGVTFLLLIIIAVLLINRYRLSSRTKRRREIEEVRNSIARDLHDDMGSTLSTINIISKLAMRENGNGQNSIHLTRISEQSSQMMETMTDMVWSINPVNDRADKLSIRMKVFAAEILEPRDIQYRFAGDESLNTVVLDARQRKNLYLVFKEAMNNIAKYSGANKVEVEWLVSNKTLIMHIRDDGEGFDELKVKHGNGLANMRSRVVDINGRFKLTSSTGKGTQIELQLPIT